MVTVVAGEEEPDSILPASLAFKVYPNPTTGIFTLELTGGEETGRVRIEVLNMKGVKVLSAELNGTRKQQFSISSMPPGLYFIHVVSGEKAETMKLIKM
jgi:hypothetical protein